MKTNQDLQHLVEKNLTFVCVTDTSVTLVPKNDNLYYIPMENPIFEDVQKLVNENIVSEFEEQDMITHYGLDNFWMKIEEDTKWDDNIYNFFVKHEIFEEIKKMK